MPHVDKKYQDFLKKTNAYIELQKQEGIEPTPQRARDALDVIAAFSLPTIDLASVTDSIVSMPDRVIPVRIYDPDPETTKPVLIYIHGGGHMCGSIELYDSITRRLAYSTSHLVVSIDYRLAPEYPYPAGLNDCLEVAERLDTLLTTYNVDTRQLVLAGDSAGGALATSLAYQTSTAIKQLILIYPGLDYTLSTPSYESLATGFLLETDRIRWYFDHYFNNRDNRHNASPLFFPQLDKFPPTLILAAELDPLVDEGEIFHQALLEAGVDCQYKKYDGAIHCFLNLETLNPVLIDDLYATIQAFTHHL